MTKHTPAFALFMSIAIVSQLPADEAVLEGLRSFWLKTARPDGSFTPGIDPAYRGMSDSAYSDLAAITYACTLHRTFGWKLPHEEKSIEFLLGRQKASGEFFNIAGTVDPLSAEGKTYNTTQGLVALRALGVKPRHYPLGVFDDILKEDYKSLPAYSTSFFPLAFLCYGRPIPAQADRAIRELMVQDGTGYLNNHIAATFHASHYYRLVGETTPKAHEMVERILRDQKADGSWLLNMPSRDRHATFDAVFTLRHEGQGRADCAAAIQRAVKWALSCRNPDGGFGHYPGSTSDADAVYFQVGVLVMGGYLKPVEPVPPDGHLLSWGHLMPVTRTDGARLRLHLDGWAAAVAFSPDGRSLATASSDKQAALWDLSGARRAQLTGHADHVVAVAFAPSGKLLATGSYDHTARVWNVSGKAVHILRGHRGPVVSVAFSPDGTRLVTGSIDGTLRIWNTVTGASDGLLVGHRSWVNAVVFTRDGSLIASGSSDGTIRLWDAVTLEERQTLDATRAEVRDIAISPDGKTLAAGLRCGTVQLWDLASGKQLRRLQAHQGDAWRVAFAPDGQTLYTAGGDWNRPGFIKAWHTSTGKQLGELQHTGEVLSLALSPDHRLLAAGGGDNAVIVWPVERIEPRRHKDTEANR